MAVQELYQTFDKALNGTTSQEEINEWWAWIIDLYPRDLSVKVVVQLADELKAGTPIQYVVHRAPFFDMNLYVNRDVLIPRPETEELVYYLLKDHPSGQLSMLDIGTGSGCIPIQVKRERRVWKVEACDISDAALQVAKKNIEEQDVDIDLFRADFFNLASFNGRGRYDIITSNPPYVDQVDKDVMTAGTRYEPDIALYAPGTSDEVYDALATVLDRLLNPGGYFYFELNEYSAHKVLDLYLNKGIESHVINDLQGKPRILSGRWPH